MDENEYEDCTAFEEVFAKYNVPACVTCCNINYYNKHSLPFICPLTRNPCLAIEPYHLFTVSGKLQDYVMKDFAEWVITYNKEVNEDTINEYYSTTRLDMDSEFISATFVNANIRKFAELTNSGNKDVYVMDAY